MSTFQIHAFWDADAGVWVAESEDVPGLATEAETWESLRDKLVALVPELLSLNSIKLGPEGAELHIVSENTIRVAVAA